MYSFLFVFIVSTITFGIVNGATNLGAGATSDCNYVVDYFWNAVNYPTNAPTDYPTHEPTPSPTLAPTEPPTPAPTRTNNTTPPPASSPSPILVISVPTIADDKINSNDGGENYANRAMLKPLTFDYCYSFPTSHFYFGTIGFSLKYRCNSAGNLVRNIYYETLECDSENTDRLEVQKFEMGNNNMKYVCNQQQNCQFTKVVNTTATTPAPTPAPSPAPTSSPSPAPTDNPSASPTHIGTPYPADAPVLIVPPAPTTAEDRINNGGDDYDWWEICDDITVGSNAADTSNQIISYFPQDICVPVSQFTNVFDYYYDPGTSYGWYCDINTNQYFMAVFTDVDCTNLDYKLIAYTNDACIPKPATNDYYRAYWTYVECGVRDDTNAFTPSPNAPPADSPVTSPTRLDDYDPLSNKVNSKFVGLVNVIGILIFFFVL